MTNHNYVTVCVCVRFSFSSAKVSVSSMRKFAQMLCFCQTQRDVYIDEMSHAFLKHTFLQICVTVCYI